MDPNSFIGSIERAGKVDYTIKLEQVHAIQVMGECGTDLCFSRKSLYFLNKKSVWFHHNYQWHTCSLLDTTHQARVVHHLRPLAKGRRRFAATIGTADNKSGHGQVSITIYWSCP